MRFEERELKPYAEPVNAQTLRQGEIYFSVQFADEEMLIPIMEAWVFAGRSLDAENHAASRLYFQDVESYRQGATMRMLLKLPLSRFKRKMLSITFLSTNVR